MSKAENKDKYRKLKLFIPLYLAIVIALVIVVYVLPGMSSEYGSTYVAEYGTLDVGYDIKCLVVRNERLHTADSAGTLERVADEGSAMRRSSRVINISGEGYYSQMRGVVAYSYDGYEDKITPDNMTGLHEDYINEVEKNCSIEQVDSEVESGDAIFKIVDNQAWYFVGWYTEKQAKKLKKGSSVTVQMGDESVKMKVHYVGNELNDGKIMIILSCNRIYEGYLSHRVVDCKVIVQSRTGILLKTSSLVAEEGRVGVMRVNKYGDINFVPIKILLQDEDDTTVAEVLENSYFIDEDGNVTYTVKNYDTIAILNDGK